MNINMELVFAAITIKVAASQKFSIVIESDDTFGDSINLASLNATIERLLNQRYEAAKGYTMSKSPELREEYLRHFIATNRDLRKILGI